MSAALPEDSEVVGSGDRGLAGRGAGRVGGFPRVEVLGRKGCWGAPFFVDLETAGPQIKTLSKEAEGSGFLWSHGLGECGEYGILRVWVGSEGMESYPVFWIFCGKLRRV